MSNGSLSRDNSLLTKEGYYPFGAGVVSPTINFIPGTGKSKEKHHVHIGPTPSGQKQFSEVPKGPSK